MHVYSSNSPVTFSDPEGLQDSPAQQVYGVNSEQQEAVYGAGMVFMAVTGGILTLGVPDPSDAVVWAAIAKGGHLITKAAGGYWKVGRGSAKPAERQVATYFAHKGDEVYLVGKRVPGTPDISINGIWWEIKSIGDCKNLSNGVQKSFKRMLDQKERLSNRSRMLLDAPGFKKHDIADNIYNQMKNNNKYTWKGVHEVMIRGSDGTLRIQPWRFNI